MKKTILFTLLILALLLAACSGGGSTPTTQPTAIPPTQPPAEPIALPTTAPTMAPSETTSTDLDALTATTWMWMEFTDPIQQFAFKTPGNYTLAFQADGTVNIKADCNNAIGAYTVEGQSLKIEVGPMSMAACPPESLEAATGVPVAVLERMRPSLEDVFLELVGEDAAQRARQARGEEPARPKAAPGGPPAMPPPEPAARPGEGGRP